ncbi:hypothetical protein M501DRAFT_1017252 [Patellaria atrata CBS 101060]|uniref:BRCT domain-containing protein n=1 Tax=Patellaria atrata CBS 101060 TaxID=1346257 RepID=A0A9P4VQE3_9PEZI|nr:hypothetical protein M501DRAFT_1017252 [Patellaria atrata CBS 101060]
MKNPLAKHVIAISGEFGSGASHDNMRRWIDAHGGKTTSTINNSTTHLICSKDHWKHQVAVVKSARNFSSIKIVSYDWLEDSLRGQTHKREAPYLWTKLEKTDKSLREARDNRERKEMKKEVRDFEAGCQSAMEDIGSGTSGKSSWAISALSSSFGPPQANLNSTPPSKSKSKSKSPDEKKDPKTEPQIYSKGTNEWPVDDPDNHHIYRDTTGFDYDVHLVRVDKSRNMKEWIRLRIYESHTFPHTYSTHFLHCLPPNDPTSHILSPIGTPFNLAFAEFRKLFRSKTKVHWDERLNTQPQNQVYMGPPEVVTSYGIGQNKMKTDWNPVLPFHYIHPQVHEPIGILPGAGMRVYGLHGIVGGTGGEEANVRYYG